MQKAIDECAGMYAGITALNCETYETKAIFIKSAVQFTIDSGGIASSQNFDDYSYIGTRVAGIEIL